MALTEPPPALMEEILDDLSAAWRTRSLIAAIELDVFSAVGNKSCAAEKIAEKIDASHKGARRLLEGAGRHELPGKRDNDYEFPQELQQKEKGVTACLNG